MTTASVHTRPLKLTPDQMEVINNELHCILNSAQFSGTRRCYEFLEFVVNRALAGDYESLTERTLGAEVFGRPIDYETGTDAIVRVRANDVRNRLAQYYSDLHQVPRVTITLLSGSYVPEFRWSEPNAAVAAAEGCDTSISPITGAAPNPSPVTEPRTRTARTALRKPIVIAAVVLIALSAGLILVPRSAKSPYRASKAFWQPLIQNHSPVIVCFGNATTFWLSPSVKRSIEDGDLARLANPGPITETHDDTVTVGNLRAAMSILNLLSSNGVANELRWPQEVQTAELNSSNVIFIGAFNNPWSKTLTQNLRFSLKETRTPTQSVWSIQDRMSSNQNWSITKAYPEQMGPDYALITRIIDSDKNRIVISVAGLSQFGTQAAGEFLTDDEALDEFARSAPRGWEHHNLQIVLGMQIDGRKIVNPRILAWNVW